MYGTPRLRSAFPVTPQSQAKGRRSQNGRVIKLQDSPPVTNTQASFVPVRNDDSTTPTIPLHVLDAPTQRFYVSAIYLAYNAWKFYEYLQLVSDQTDSLWLFLKWGFVDGVFFFGLPALRIPWLEWAYSTSMMVFFIHSVLDAILMFRIMPPWEVWGLYLLKLIWDRELAISERNVNPASILHNSSLILGKQIIHILPEGLALLNPDGLPFCLDASKPSIDLPIFLNQTTPIGIDLLRFDLDTNANETIAISAKEVQKILKHAVKEVDWKDGASARTIKFPVKRTGLYRLQRVLDESKLEVQRRLSDTLVVNCPTASIKSVPQNKCRGALSDFYIQVNATPPLKIKYSKTVNREDQGTVFMNIHPPDLVSPLAQQRTSGALIKLDEGPGIDVTWARTQQMSISLNETLGVSGGWRYSIDEVHDACGNVANFSSLQDLRPQRSGQSEPTEQIFTVHEWPRVALEGCSSQQPLKVAKGRSARLPLRLSSTVTGRPAADQHSISYLFTPQDELVLSGEHASGSQVELVMISNSRSYVEISEPGLYTLQSVSTEFCTGDVMEPSSCLLMNPPEPDMAISVENITDKCAGNSIGLSLDLDLVGTPPFKISYTEQRKGGRLDPKVETISQLRYHKEFIPSEAGHYTYEFLDISDAVYDIQSLKSKGFKYDQDVKPPGSARFWNPRPVRKACTDEVVSFDIKFSGQAPWTLEYDLVRGAKRKKHKIEDIESEVLTLTTERLSEGGEYLISLTSVTDGSGCKIPLKEEAKIEVRHQKPKASFGLLDGKRTTLTLEDKKIKLPLKLSGEPPWTIHYRRNQDSVATNMKTILKYSNDHLDVHAPGTYELVDVSDATCPGVIESSAGTFEVVWIGRPSLSIVKSSSIELQNDRYVKQAVCEADQDSFEVSMTGNPPYHGRYEIQVRPEHGAPHSNFREFSAGLGSASVGMETSQTGHYQYIFTELGDQLYDHDRHKFRALKVSQIVHSRPYASFDNNGKTYSYCREEESGDEFIPMTLKGEPPFYLEIAIRHHATTRPEIVKVPHIDKPHYNFHIPHKVLGLGTHSVTIFKVRDSRGCERQNESGGPVVHVNVAEIPTIAPLESATDYCVGDYINYALSGTPPFNVYYTFQGATHKASTSTTSFRRISDKPGDFTITAISDKASTDTCRSKTGITKVIHELPSVRLSKGKTAEIDIHEGGEADILVEFSGTPPFEYTYTRSTNAAKGKKPIVLETKHDVSNEYAKLIKASDEGTYEVISIRDKYCGFSTQEVQAKSGKKLLTL